MPPRLPMRALRRPRLSPKLPPHDQPRHQATGPGICALQAALLAHGAFDDDFTILKILHIRRACMPDASFSKPLPSRCFRHTMRRRSVEDDAHAARAAMRSRFIYARRRRYDGGRASFRQYTSEELDRASSFRPAFAISAAVSFDRLFSMLGHGAHFSALYFSCHDAADVRH